MIPRVPDLEIGQVWNAERLTPPDREELEEGISLWPFSHTSILYGVSSEDVVRELREEAEAIDILRGLAEDESEFEGIASALEGGFFDDPPSRLAGSQTWAELAGRFEENPCCAFEVGVSALSLTLASVDCLPAASCRGHQPAREWEDYPIVYFGSDRVRAELVSEACGLKGCRFEIGVQGLCMISAGSIEDTHGLAQHLSDIRDHFAALPSATYVPENAPEQF